MIYEPISQDTIRCPHCGGLEWSCWDERVMDCWDKDGNLVGHEVAGGMRCGNCGKTYLHYALKNDDPECECEDF